MSLQRGVLVVCLKAITRAIQVQRLADLAFAGNRIPVIRNRHRRMPGDADWRKSSPSRERREGSSRAKPPER